jgi:rare lipoprotein A
VPRIVRTRAIVAIAALIAASALVVGPETAGAQPSRPAQSIDSAQFRAVAVALPSGLPSTSITTLDTANRSAGWLGPDSALPDAAAGPMAAARPPVAVPAVVPTRVAKNPWHFDPNISWYGPGFYGRRTACGVALTPSVLGVASLTLPCGTRVTFRNPANGRTATVPVIDRGPYVGGRIWDMTGGLCTYLDHCYTGTMDWRIAGG